MRRWALPVACVASVLAAASLWAPWHHSGEVTRSGVALARSAERLGLIEGWGSVVLLAGRALPLLAAFAVAAAITSHRRVAGGTAVLAGAVAIGAACVVWSEVPGRLEVGPLVGACTGAVAVASGVVCLLARDHRLSSDGASGSS